MYFFRFEGVVCGIFGGNEATFYFNVPIFATITTWWLTPKVPINARPSTSAVLPRGGSIIATGSGRTCCRKRESSRNKCMHRAVWIILYFSYPIRVDIHVSVANWTERELGRCMLHGRCGGKIEWNGGVKVTFGNEAKIYFVMKSRQCLKWKQRKTCVSQMRELITFL